MTVEANTYVWGGKGKERGEGADGKKKEKTNKDDEVLGASQILGSLAPRHLEVVQLLAGLGRTTMGNFKREAKKKLLVQDGRALEALMVKLLEHGLMIRKGGKGADEVDVRRGGLRTKVLAWKRAR